MASDDSSIIETAEQVADLPVAQWVWDANDTPMCLVDTNVGWPQRMWMTSGGSGYLGIQHANYPLTLVDVDEDDACPHQRGTNECGHCKRCGVVVEAPKDLTWHLHAVGGDRG